MKNHKIRVLIGDEFPAFREGLKKAINDTSDMEVVATAKDGREVLDMVDKIQTDVAVLSVLLPLIDGITISRRIKEKYSEIGIIIVSPYTQGSYIMPSLRAGALGYLTKTSPLEEITDCIRSVKAGETVIDSRAVGKLLRIMLDNDSSDEVKYIEKLHGREMEVLSMVAKGLHNRDIAEKLGISDHTVHTHITSIFHKLGVTTRIEALICALREGWLNFDDLIK